MNLNGHLHKFRITINRFNKIFGSKAEKARKGYQSRSMVDELILSHSLTHTDHMKKIF